MPRHHVIDAVKHRHRSQCVSDSKRESKTQNLQTATKKSNLYSQKPNPRTVLCRRKTSILNLCWVSIHFLFSSTSK